MVAVIRWASSPVMPTASGPCWLSSPTSSRCDLAGQHHPYDVHGLGGGDPQAGLELADQAVPVELRADLRAAAVHDDGLEAGVPQEDDVLGEGAP